MFGGLIFGGMVPLLFTETLLSFCYCMQKLFCHRARPQSETPFDLGLSLTRIQDLALGLRLPQILVDFRLHGFGFKTAH